MTALWSLAATLGWRWALGIAVGAVLAWLPAYEVGVWTESAAAEERTQRVLAERDMQRMGTENARVDAAAAARVAAARGADNGGVSDDGFRRD